MHFKRIGLVVYLLNSYYFNSGRYDNNRTNYQIRDDYYTTNNIFAGDNYTADNNDKRNNFYRRGNDNS